MHNQNFRSQNRGNLAWDLLMYVLRKYVNKIEYSQNRGSQNRIKITWEVWTNSPSLYFLFTKSNIHKIEVNKIEV